MKWVKRIALALIVIFALFYLVTKPTEAAGAVRAVFGAIWEAIMALGTFFGSLA